MKKLILAAIAAFLLSVPAKARDLPVDAMVLKDKDLIVTLLQTPCQVQGVLDQVKPEYRKSFKTANVLFKGESFKACWATPPNDVNYVLVLDETGDGGFIPKDRFKPATGL